MTIYAIDPGNKESAFVVWQDGSLDGFDKISNEDLLQTIVEASWKDATVAIEMIASYGMAVGKEVFETCVWIGRFMQAITERGGMVELVYRKDVKLHHCQSMKAKDANIIQALKDRFGDKGTKRAPGFFYGVSADVWQAIALAVYVADREVDRAA